MWMWCRSWPVRATIVSSQFVSFSCPPILSAFYFAALAVAAPAAAPSCRSSLFWVGWLIVVDKWRAVESNCLCRRIQMLRTTVSLWWIFFNLCSLISTVCVDGIGNGDIMTRRYFHSSSGNNNNTINNGWLTFNDGQWAIKNDVVIISVVPIKAKRRWKSSRGQFECVSMCVCVNICLSFVRV